MQVGDVLEGKYRIVRLVGAGGMGSVFEAEHTFLHRRVAVKVLGQDCAQDPDAVRRFHREAQVAAAVGHDNICEVVDFGRAADQQPFIVMQLLQGTSLGALLANAGALEPGRAVGILVQVLEGLQAAHDAGIIHRDMKPDNVFLTRLAGREDFVKILDFGISKVRPLPGSDTAKITQTGAVLGSPLYMSPEQAQGETELDVRTDVWSVGMMAYEMLTATRPFDGPNFHRVLYNVLARSVPPPVEVRPALSPALSEVVMRALERDIGRRFPSCNAFREALLEAWAGADARPPSASARPAASDPEFLLAPTLDATPGMGLRKPPVPGTSSNTPPGTTIAAEKEAASRRRRRNVGLSAAVAAGVAIVAVTLFVLFGGEGAVDAAAASDAAAATADAGAPPAVRVAVSPPSSAAGDGASPPALPPPSGASAPGGAPDAPPTGDDAGTAASAPPAGPGDAPSVISPDAGVVDELPERPLDDEVERGFESAREAVTLCAAGRTTAVEAALKLEGATGKVLDVELSGATGAVGDCVRALLGAVVFPRFAADSTVVRHRYTFGGRRPPPPTAVDAGRDTPAGPSPPSIDENYYPAGRPDAGGGSSVGRLPAELPP